MITEWVNEDIPRVPVKRVLLINPPDVDSTLFDYDTAKRGRANNYPSYGLGVLARHLLNAGYEVDIINLNHEVLKFVYHFNQKIDYNSLWKSILHNKLESFEPDLVGVTCLFSIGNKSLENVCEEIRKTSIPIAIGGVHITHDVDNVIEAIKPDYVFLNESENAFIRFLEYMNGRAPVECLAQLIVVQGDKRIKFSKKVIPNTKEMDVIPAFELMDVESHSTYGTIGSWYGFRYESTQIATVLSNRGCRAHCTFCNVRSFNGEGVRQRSVESVLDELQALKDRGVGHILWLDDDLLMRDERALDLFNGMVKRNLNMTWDATNGLIAASLRDEMMAAMAASGCIGFAIGMESGNAEILKKIKKPSTPRILRRSAEVMTRYPQINTRTFLMIGFPNETLGQILDTINLAEEMNLDWNNINILQPWKNTPIYDAMVDQGLLGEEEGALKGDVAPYHIGPYSRQRAVELGKIQQSQYGEKKGGNGIVDFSDLNRVPSIADLDDIWFYMNVRLNFERLLKETRQVKLNQQLTYLRYVATKTAPDNALILYFYAYLQWRVLGEIDESLVESIAQRLEASSYWREKFQMFGLNLKDITDYDFPKTLFLKTPKEEPQWQSA